MGFYWALYSHGRPYRYWATRPCFLLFVFLQGGLPGKSDGWDGDDRDHRAPASRVVASRRSSHCVDPEGIEYPDKTYDGPPMTSFDSSLQIRTVTQFSQWRNARSSNSRTYIQTAKIVPAVSDLWYGAPETLPASSCLPYKQQQQPALEVGLLSAHRLLP